MRLMKMFGLAALVASSAMVLVGASTASASAKHTALCTEHTELGCSGEATEAVKFLALTSTLVSSLATVLCLGSHGTAEVEKPFLSVEEERLGLHLTELTWVECGTNAEHNNCTVTTEAFPLLEVLKTALNKGASRVNSSLPALIHVVCGSLINCKFTEPVEGKEFAVEGAAGETPAMLTATELEVKKAGGIFCPAVSKWTALYDIYRLEAVYLTE